MERAVEIWVAGGGQGPGQWNGALPLRAAPPALESARAKEFPKRGHAATAGEGGEGGGVPRPFRSRSPPASRCTCARPAEPLPAAPRAPADSGCPLRRDGGGGVVPGSAGRGGAAPPGLPRDGLALGAGNEEAAGGGSGGGAAAGTHASAGRPAAARSPCGRDRSQFQGGQKVPGTHPSSPRPVGPLGAPPGSARSHTRALSPCSRLLPDSRAAPTQAPRAGTRTPQHPRPRSARLDAHPSRRRMQGQRDWGLAAAHQGRCTVAEAPLPWDSPRSPRFPAPGWAGPPSSLPAHWAGWARGRGGVGGGRRREANSSGVPRGTLRVPPGGGGGAKRKLWAQRGNACPSRSASWLRPGPQVSWIEALCLFSSSSLPPCART